MYEPDPLDAALAVRLASVEGQIRGISRMVREGRRTEEILIQATAARGALASIARLVLDRGIDLALRQDLPPKGPATAGGPHRPLRTTRPRARTSPRPQRDPAP